MTQTNNKLRGKSIVHKSVLILLVALYCSCFPTKSYSQTGKKAILYKNGVELHCIDCDSISIRITDEPDIPDFPDNVYVLYNTDVYCGKKFNLYKPDGTLYRSSGFCGIKVHKDDWYYFGTESSFFEGEQRYEIIHVWKNGEYFYGHQAKDNWDFYLGIEVDGEDLYLYGYTGGNHDFFYLHNGTFNYRYHSPKKYVRDFLVNEGKKYFVYYLVVEPSFHSGNSWTSPVRIVGVECDGNMTELQERDGTKFNNTIEECIIRNGKPYVCGNTRITSSSQTPDDNPPDIFHGFVTCPGDFYHELKDTHVVEKLDVDDNGTYYAVALVPNSDRRTWAVYSNGKKLYELPVPEYLDDSLTEITQLSIKGVSVIDHKVYVYGQFLGIQEEDGDWNYLYAGFLYKDGELIWGPSPDNEISDIKKKQQK